MRVIVKHPGMDPEVIEVEGITDINKLVGNVDEAGNGLDSAGTDERFFIAQGVDQYVKSNAAYNTELKPNLWSSNGMTLFCGTIVFAGYNNENRTDCGACSLTDDQIKECIKYINMQAY